MSNEDIKYALSLAEQSDGKGLNLGINGKRLSTGENVPRSDVQSPPSLALDTGSSTDEYVLICLDLDAPYPSFSVLSPILHWIQSGLKRSTTGDEGALTSSDPVIVPWLAPSPPPGSSQHRYLLILYDQPQDFDVTKHTDSESIGVVKRMRCDLSTWETKLGLAKPIAANYFDSQ